MDNIKDIIKIIVIMLMIIISVLIIVNNDEIIDRFQIRYLVIKSGSMQPTLNINDVIVIKKEKQYNVGDIITYKDENNFFITHRISRIENNDFITKGDNNNCEDPNSVSIDNVKGKVILIISGEILKIIVISISSIIIIWMLKKGKRNEKNN